MSSSAMTLKVEIYGIVEDLEAAIAELRSQVSFSSDISVQQHTVTPEQWNVERRSFWYAIGHWSELVRADIVLVVAKESLTQEEVNDFVEGVGSLDGFQGLFITPDVKSLAFTRISLH